MNIFLKGPVSDNTTLIQSTLTSRQQTIFRSTDCPVVCCIFVSHDPGDFIYNVPAGAINGERSCVIDNATEVVYAQLSEKSARDNLVFLVIST